MTDNKQIVGKVGTLFRKYGIKSITMDDVARELGISKKTLYQIVPDKNALIQLVLRSDFYETKNSIIQVNNEDIDAVKQLIKIQELMCIFLSTMSLAFNYDLRKYYPEIYEEIRKEYLDLFKETFLKNLKRGKEQDLFRQEVDESIMARYYLNLIDQIPQSTLITIGEFTAGSFSKSIRLYHLHGLVNNNGRELMKKYTDNIETIDKTEAV